VDGIKGSFPGTAVLQSGYMQNLVGLVLIVLLGSGFFSSMEAALFSVSFSRAKILEMKGVRGSKALMQIKSAMSRPISVIVIFNNIFNIVGSMFVGVVATEVLGSGGLGFVSALLTFLIIVFGEILPKTFGENYAESISLRISKPLLAATKVFSPLIWIFEKITNRFVKKKRIVSEEELRILSELGHLEGSIEEDEHDLIQRVFTLNDLTAKDIMTPRTMLVALPAAKTLRELENEIYDLVNSRIPLYGEGIDDIVGLVHRRDLLQSLAQDKKDISLKDLSEGALFVSEGAKADELLPLFQKKGDPFGSC